MEQRIDISEQPLTQEEILENQESICIDDEVAEFYYSQAVETKPHQEQKTLIRQKCSELGKKVGLDDGQAKIIAQYHFNLLQKNPEMARKFWDQLYGLNFYAKDPEMAAQYFQGLVGLISDSKSPGDLYHLWNAAGGVVRGEYEVLPINPTKNDAGYMFYLRHDAKTQFEDPRRKESFKRISSIAKSSVVRIPVPAYREFEFAVFDASQRAVLEGINDKILKQFQTLISSGSVELEEINDYVKWLKFTLMATIDSLTIHSKQKDKYREFFDTVIFPYLDNLHFIAMKILEENPNNNFFRDIVLEAHLVNSQLLDENHKEVSIIDKFEDSWNTLGTLLENPPIIEDDVNKQISGQPMTIFFSSAKTPVSGEAKPPRQNTSEESVKIVKPKGGTIMGISAPKTIPSPEPQPTSKPCTQTRQEISKMLNKTVIGTPSKPLEAVDFLDDDPDAITGVDEVKAAIEKAETVPVHITIIEGSDAEEEAIKDVARETRNILGSVELNSAKGVRELDALLKECVMDRLLTPGIKKAFVSTILLYVADLQYLGKKCPLWIYLRNIFSQIIPDQNPLPMNRELEELESKIKDIEELPHIRTLAQKLNIEGLVTNPMHDFKGVLDQKIGCLKFHIKTDQTVRTNPYDREVFDKLKEHTYSKLDNFANVKKRLVGGFGARLFRRMRRSKEENETLEKYIKLMEEFLAEFKEKALDPTFKNIEEIYFFSSPDASQTTE